MRLEANRQKHERGRQRQHDRGAPRPTAFGIQLDAGAQVFSRERQRRSYWSPAGQQVADRRRRIARPIVPRAAGLAGVQVPGDCCSRGSLELPVGKAEELRVR
jgi:hypothetical protein